MGSSRIHIESAPDWVAGRYRIARSLGGGASGQVFLAHDAACAGRPVAVKLLRPDGPWDAEALREEFLALSAVVHPAFARALDYGRDRETGHVFLVSEHVEGRPLYRALAEARPKAVLDVAVGLLAALGYLHARGLAHGDIKPGNILIQAHAGRPVPRVLDLGLAATRWRAGTPAYMAPEALEAAPPERARPADDLYALGVTLHHGTVGTLPFDPSDPRAIGAWHRRGEAFSPARQRRETPEGLDALVRALTAPRPADRPASAPEALELVRNRWGPFPEPSFPPRLRIDFVGRQDALARARTILENTARGDEDAPRLLVITGPPGIGKSRFIEQLEPIARLAGLRVARPAGGPDLLPHVASALVPDLAIPPSVSAEGRRARALQALQAALAGAPALVVVDPLPSDARPEDVARLLAATADLRPPRALIVVAARAQEDLAGLLPEDLPIRREAVRLGPLASEDMAEAVRGYFGCDEPGAAWRAAIARRARGDPRRLEAILRALGRAGARVDRWGRLQVPLSPEACPDPEDPEGDLSGRVADALAEDRETLELLAIDPRTPLASEEIRAALDHAARLGPLERLDLVRRDAEGRIGLSGEAAAEAVLAGASRRGLRARARARARVLLGRGPEGWLGASRALRAAGDRGEARTLALRAGRRARARGSAALAFEGYRLAVEIGPRLRDRRAVLARLRLAEVAAGAGRPERGLAALMPLIARPRLVPAAARGRALERAAALERARGDLKAAARLLRKAVAVFEDAAVSPARRSLCRSELALALAHAGRKREAERALAGALPEEAPVGRLAGRQLARALANCGTVQALLGRREEALAAFSRALAIGRRLGEPQILLGPLNEIGIARAQAGDTAGAIEVFREARSCAQEAGEVSRELALLCNLAIAHYKRRALPEARARYLEALELATSLGERELLPAIWSGLGAIERLRGAYRDAIRCYRKALARPGRAAFRVNATVNLGEIFQLLGRYRTALRLRRAGAGTAREIGDAFLTALGRFGLGTTELALGMVAAARKRLGDALREAPDHRLAAGALWGLGRAAEIDGDLAEAARCYARAARRSRVAGDPDYLLLGLVGLARVRTRGERTGAARRVLARAQAGAGRAARDFRLQGCLLAAELDLRSRTAEGPPIDPEHAARVEDALRTIDEEAVELPAVRREALALRIALARRAGQGERLPPLREEALRLLESERRHVPREAADAFARLPSVRALERLARQIPPPAAETVRAGAGEARLLELAAAGREGLERLLATASAAARARGAALVAIGRGGRRVPVARCGAAVPSIALERARRRGTPIEGEGWTAIPLPGSPGALVLTGAGLSRARLDPLLRALAVALRLEEAGEERRALAEALRRERQEVRRLTERLAAEKDHLETEVIARRAELVEVRRQLEEKARELEDGFRLSSIVGESPAMRRVLAELPEVAAASIPVLVTGESGTGKDLVARAIHALSPRRTRPFLSESCAALPEGLLEVELFGAVRGAYTDAVTDRPGLFERVAGGTLYLDEVGGIPAAVQARVLRVLEERRVRRVGGEAAIAVSFRLVSSSRRSGAELEKDPVFRRDFFYRVRGIEIALPPLRERPEDIPALVDAIIDRWGRGGRGRRPAVDRSALRALERYGWPGNVRELENEIQRILIFSPDRITAGMLALGETAQRAGPASPARPRRTIRQVREDTEREYLGAVLAETAGNVAEAARRSGLSRRYLTMLLRRYGIDPDRYRRRR